MEKIINNENRRDFLKKAGFMIGVGICAGSVSTILTSCEKDQSIIIPPPQAYSLSLAPFPKLATAGGIEKVVISGKNNNKPFIIKRIDQTTFVVHDSICPHQGCEVDLPTTPTSGMDCPCHHVVFSPDDGSVMKNPISWASQPLPSFKVQQFDSGNNILKIEI